MILPRLFEGWKHGTCSNIEVVQICGRKKNGLTFVVSNKVMVEGKALFAVISNVKTTPHATRRSDFSGLFE